MLSRKLLEAIEYHCDPILSGLIEHIRRDPELSYLRSLPESQVRDWALDTLRNLADWLVAGREEALAGRPELLKQTALEESVPLPEAVRVLQHLKDSSVDFIRDAGFDKAAFDAYVECLVGRFFDTLVYRLVRNHQEMARRASRPAA